MEADAAAQEVSPCPSEGRSLIVRSHLDAVQAVAFGPEATVVSGSWDCTVKVWRLANDKSGNRYVTRILSECGLIRADPTDWNLKSRSAVILHR
jgi:WD40 repeat protein